VQESFESEKRRTAALERLIQKSEDTLEDAESSLSRRSFYQLKIIGILNKRSNGDFTSYAEDEDEIYDLYISAVDDWNIGINMNRTIIRRIFGDTIGDIFYSGGPNIQYEDVSITLKFITLHREIMRLWYTYKKGEKFEVGDLEDRHWKQATQVRDFYDLCLGHIVNLENDKATKDS
jgi:hypothetical protein